jgi:uncharacterized membrane protein YfcA
MTLQAGAHRDLRMDLGIFAIIAATVVVAAFVQGTTGLGFALIVAPVIGLLKPELLPVCLLILMLPLNAYVAWRERAALDRSGFGWITVGRAGGTFGGLWLLRAVPASGLALLIGGVTILAAVTSLALPRFRAGQASLVTAGVVTGITETATGIGGPPLALVYQHHAAPVLRSTIASCILVGELLSLAVLAVAGKLDAPQFTGALLLLPALAAGAVLSRFVHTRVHGRGLRTFVLVFAVVSGLVLVLRG